jgi:hypothetical protein
MNHQLKDYIAATIGDVHVRTRDLTLIIALPSALGVTEFGDMVTDVMNILPLWKRDLVKLASKNSKLGHIYTGKKTTNLL